MHHNLFRTETAEERCPKVEVVGIICDFSVALEWSLSKFY